MNTPTSIKQDFVLRMNEMLANLVINEEENKRVREQLEVVKKKYEKEELAVEKMKNAYEGAGFTNPNAYRSRNIYQDELYESERRVIALDNIIQKLRLIERMKKDFGEQSALVPIKDFNQIISKHKLVCGRMNEYCGTVPFDKLANIARFQERIRSSYWRNNIRIASRSLNVHLFIAAPKECFQFQVEEFDPFVCCLTEYGVMVLEAWDIEAQDKTLAYFREQESLVSLATMHNKKSILNKLINKIKTLTL